MSVLQRAKYKGFTFMEVIFCLAIIVAISSGIYIVSGRIFETGRFNAAKSDVSAISLAVAQYHFEIGSWPGSLATLATPNGQYGPWLSDSTITDPWGKQYNYAYISAQRKYAVWSNGPNGTNNSGESPTTFAGDDIGIFGH